MGPAGCHQNAKGICNGHELRSNQRLISHCICLFQVADEENLQDFQNEIRVMRRSRHPNVVEFMGNVFFIHSFYCVPCRLTPFLDASQTHSVALVSTGACFEESKMCIVTEFLSNGCLESVSLFLLSLLYVVLCHCNFPVDSQC